MMLDTTYVYFIRDGLWGDIKIGYSLDPRLRMREIRGARCGPLRLLAFVEGGREQEAELHRRFAGSRLDGEWFAVTAELLQEVRGARRRRALAIASLEQARKERALLKMLRQPLEKRLAGAYR